MNMCIYVVDECGCVDVWMCGCGGEDEGGRERSGKETKIGDVFDMRK